MARRYAARIDVNQPELVEYLRSFGASFQHTHTIPGALDGIVGFAGIDQRVEIKDPKKTKSEKKLTTLEKDVFDQWAGRKPIVIETKDDCLNLLKKLRRESIKNVPHGTTGGQHA